MGASPLFRTMKRADPCAIPVVTLSLGLQLTKPRTPNAEGLNAEVLMVENGLHFPTFALRFLGFPHLAMIDVIIVASARAFHPTSITEVPRNASECPETTNDRCIKGIVYVFRSVASESG